MKKLQNKGMVLLLFDRNRLIEFTCCVLNNSKSSRLIFCFEGFLEPLLVLKIMIPEGGQNLNGGA